MNKEWLQALVPYALAFALFLFLGQLVSCDSSCDVAYENGDISHQEYKECRHDEALSNEEDYWGV